MRSIIDNSKNIHLIRSTLIFLKDIKHHLGDLGMEVLHVLAKHLTKLAEHLFVPGVVFQVHLRLDLLSGGKMSFS